MTEERRRHILAVEDNPDTQLLMRYLLQPQYELTIVTHVDEALETAREGTFDLVVLDINLGEQRTGLDLLESLRAMPAYAQKPALALTAYAMPGDEERFIAAGFDAYISKPFTRNDLHATVERLLEKDMSSGLP